MCNNFLSFILKEVNSHSYPQDRSPVIMRVKLHRLALTDTLREIIGTVLNVLVGTVYYYSLLLS